MSLPFDEGRDPSARREDYRSGSQFTRDEFRDKYSLMEYWRNRPILELKLQIRKLENENNPESTQMAQRLRQIASELHDKTRAKPSTSRSLSPIREGTPVLPPSAISGRITGGNYPRGSNVQDIHRGYSQMSPRTQQLLDQRHRAAQDQFRALPPIQSSTSMDSRIDQMRRYDTGLSRQPYPHEMRYGTGLDVDRFRREVPQTLARNFRDTRYRNDRAREIDSRNTQLASLEVWRQRQLDKKYHPKRYQTQRLPRQHQFGPQEPQSYSEEWKLDSKKVMPFNPVEDYYSGGPSTPGRPMYPRSSPRPRRSALDAERPSLGQRVANRYVSEARAYQPLPRQQRIAMRRQRWPLRDDERNLGIDMSENAQHWKMRRR